MSGNVCDSFGTIETKQSITMARRDKYGYASNGICKALCFDLCSDRRSSPKQRTKNDSSVCAGERCFQSKENRKEMH